MFNIPSLIVGASIGSILVTFTLLAVMRIMASRSEAVSDTRRINEESLKQLTRRNDLLEHQNEILLDLQKDFRQK